MGVSEGEHTPGGVVTLDRLVALEPGRVITRAVFVSAGDSDFFGFVFKDEGAPYRLAYRFRYDPDPRVKGSEHVRSANVLECPADADEEKAAEMLVETAKLYATTARGSRAELLELDTDDVVAIVAKLLKHPWAKMFEGENGARDVRIAK